MAAAQSGALDPAILSTLDNAYNSLIAHCEDGTAGAYDFNNAAIQLAKLVANCTQINFDSSFIATMNSVNPDQADLTPDAPFVHAVFQAQTAAGTGVTWDQTEYAFSVLLAPEDRDAQLTQLRTYGITPTLTEHKRLLLQMAGMFQVGQVRPQIPPKTGPRMASASGAPRFQLASAPWSGCGYLRPVSTGAALVTGVLGLGCAFTPAWPVICPIVPRLALISLGLLLTRMIFC